MNPDPHYFLKKIFSLMMHNFECCKCIIFSHFSLNSPVNHLLNKRRLASLGVWRVLPTLIVADMQVIVSQTVICGICSLVQVKDVKEECCFSPAETNTRNQTEQPTRMETCQYSFHVTCSTHNANSLSFTRAREIKRTK